jgi:hypothetical protein
MERPKTRKDVQVDASVLRERLALPAVAKPSAVPERDLMSTLLDAISNPAVDPAKLNALLDIRGRIMREEAEVGYRRAYRAVKMGLPRIDKDGKIDEGTTKGGRQGKKARYATYENINVLTAPILERHGLDLSLHAEPKPDGNGILMRATLSYVATTKYGETVYSESSVVPMPPEPSGSKNAAQAVSSALAYAKRNAVVLVLNIISQAPEDRDRDGYPPKEIEGTVVDTPVTPAQIAKLNKAIEEAGVPLERVCEKYGLNKIEELPGSLFNAVIKSCETFKQAKESRRG